MVSPQSPIISWVDFKHTAYKQKPKTRYRARFLFIQFSTCFFHVVKTSCFLADINAFAEFNDVYAKYFTGRPARSCVAVAALPKGALVEVEVIAKEK